MAVRELRLALGMRGGVSLAVWIGGACAEIDAVRRAVGAPAAGAEPFWQRVGAASGYDSVLVDVLAGASAGGLNGVVFAASEVYDFSMDGMRDVWAEVGDTAALLRERRVDASWPSLFRGDTYFFCQLEKALRTFAQAGSRLAHPPAVDLRLPATLVEPVRRPARSPSDEQLVDRRFASGFAFTQPPYPWLRTDLPPVDHAEPCPQGWSSRLAMAARSTSSFPGAFEAAKLTSTRPASFGAATTQAGGVGVDMSGVLLDSGSPAGGVSSFVVSDGGVLDNIPLGRALTAVAEAPADCPTDRYLLYLQPGAPSEPRAPENRRSDRLRETAVSVLLGVVRGRMPAEDIRGDLAQLDDYNTRIEQAASVRTNSFAALTSSTDLRNAAEAAWGSYRVLRAVEDQRLTSTLLDDPLGTLGEDPFPRQVGGAEVPDAMWRSPLDHTCETWGPDLLPSRDRLERALRRSFEARLPPALPDDVGECIWRVGVRPVLRVTQLLLEWAQYLESQGVTGASEAKATLYRIATFLRVAVDRPRRLGWVVVAATRPDPWQGEEALEEALVRTSLQALRPLVRLPAAEVTGIVAALSADNTQVLEQACHRRLLGLDGIPTAWATTRPDEGGFLDLRNAVVDDLLVDIARGLALARAEAGAGHPDQPGDIRLSPGAYLDRVMDAEVSATELAALEVVCFLEFATGLPGRRPVSLRRVSSAAETPLAPRFEALLRAARREDKWFDKDVPMPPDDPGSQRGLHVDLKLAGNEYANFSAFLDARWRLNDWMWGRLDAVATLVELLVTPASLRASLQGEERPVTAVETLLLGPDATGDTPERELRTFLRSEVWTTRTQQAVEKEVTALLDTDPDADAGAPGSVSAVRRAFVAVRQWEIVCSELGLCDEGARAGQAPGGGRLAPAALGPALLAAVAGYDIGAEGFRSPRVRKQVRSRLYAIGYAAGTVLHYNITQHAPGKRWSRLAFRALAGVIRPSVRRTGSALSWWLTRRRWFTSG